MRQRIQSDTPDRPAGGFAELLVLLLVAVLALLVFGLIVDPFAVVLAGAILLGLFVLTGLVVVAWHRTRARPRSSVLDGGRLRRSLDETIAAARTKVSAPTLVKIQSIRRTVLEIVPRAEVLAGDVERVHVLERTVLDYLPTALASYLDLPREFATTAVIRDDKTAQDLLLDQVTLLDDMVQEIADTLNRRRSDQLVVHGRFLEDRFRRDRVLAQHRFVEDRLRRPHVEPVDPSRDPEPPEPQV